MGGEVRTYAQWRDTRSEMDRARRDRKCVVPSCCAVTRTVAAYWYMLVWRVRDECGSPHTGFQRGRTVVYVSLATIGS